MKAPAWWCQSELVVGLKGEHGILSKSETSEGEAWTVTADDLSKSWVNPDPGYWMKRPQPQIGPMQLRRILYEADRAYIASLGRSAMTEWISVPESQRAGETAPKCCPIDESQQGSIRRLIQHALENALTPYVTKY